MKKIVILFLLLILYSLIIGAEYVDLAGEHLEYVIKWNHLLFPEVPVTKASFSVKKIYDDSGQLREYQIIYLAKTNGWIKYLNKVPGINLPNLDKTGISYVNPTTFLPNEFYHREVNNNVAETWLIKQNFSINYKKTRNDIIVKKYELAIQNTVFDILSAIVYFRTVTLASWQPDSINETKFMTLCSDDTSKQIPIIYQGEKLIDYNGQNINSIIFLIKLGEFATKLMGTETDLLIYFENGNNFKPLLIEADVFGGQAKAILIESSFTE